MFLLGQDKVFVLFFHGTVERNRIAFLDHLKAFNIKMTAVLKQVYFSDSSNKVIKNN